jgi:hypothetical protein
VVFDAYDISIAEKMQYVTARRVAVSAVRARA